MKRHNWDEIIPKVALIWNDWPHMKGATGEVARIFNVSKRTAEVWVAEARKRGLITYKSSVCHACRGTGIRSNEHHTKRAS